MYFSRIFYLEYIHLQAFFIKSILQRNYISKMKQEIRLRNNKGKKSVEYKKLFQG